MGSDNESTITTPNQSPQKRMVMKPDDEEDALSLNEEEQREKERIFGDNDGDNDTITEDTFTLFDSSDPNQSKSEDVGSSQNQSKSVGRNKELEGKLGENNESHSD